MPPLVITRETTRIALASRHLQITSQHAPDSPETTTTVPLAAIDRVIMCGAPRITFPTLWKLVGEDIPCFFLTEGGRWKAALHGAAGYHGDRRLRQYRRSDNAAFALSVARSLVHAKILNSRRVLQRLAANRGLSRAPAHLDACRELRSFAATALAAPSPEVLRGFEGKAAALYFARLAEFFPPDFPFSERNRHPPRDPPNALLSYAYAVLVGELECAIRLHGLDPAIGCLHSSRLSAPALALDLLEPFRPAIADLLVMDILNHAMLDPAKDFIPQSDGAIFLAPSARAVFFSRYEHAMTRRFRPRNDTPSTTFRSLLAQAVESFLTTLEHDAPPSFFLLP